MYNKKRVVSLALLVVLISAFVIPFVAAQTDILDPIGNFFDDWLSGENLSSNTAKVFFFFIVLMVVLGISDNLPFFGGDDKKFIRVAFSVAVTFLSTAYLTPAEVYSIMTAYTGLGYIISIGVPFLVLIYFSYSVSTHLKGDLTTRIFNEYLARAGWWGLFIFSCVRAYNARELEGAFGLSLAVVAVSLVMAVIAGKLMKTVHKDVLDEAIKERQNDIRISAKIEGTEADTARSKAGS